MMSTEKIRKITITAALGALTALMGITNIGMIPLPTVAITIMHIPVIIAAILIGPWSGATVGLIMGVYSLIRAAVSPTSALSPFFVNPFISILPRVLLGIVAWGIYALFSKIRIKNKSFEYLSVAFSAFLGTLCHTLFVMLALMTVKAIDLKVAVTVLLINGLPESVGAVVVTVAVIAAWRGIDGYQKKSNLSEIDMDSKEE